MGYSARYHATSLIAVFLALAVGILIGAEFGGDALTQTRKDLEHSLVGNLQDARSHADELSGELGRSNEFGERVYPVLTRDKLGGKRLGDRRLRRPAERPHLGGRGRDRADRGEAGRGRGGARAGRRQRPRRRPLEDPLLRAARTEPDQLTELGTGLGRQLVLGGTLVEVVRGHLFSRASGSFGGLDGVIVVRDQPEDMGPVQKSRATQFETAMLGGMTATRVPTVGIETTATEPSSVSFFAPTTSRPSTTSTRRPASWRWSTPCSAPRAASASRAAPTGSCPTC